jgi:tetratricopeptide (TPR) repeat protein
MNRKHVKRWCLVLAVLLLLAMAGGGLYGIRQHRIAGHIDSLKPAGLASLDDERYRDALIELGSYLQHHPDDVTALRGYLEARVNVEEPEGGHIRGAIGGYRSLVQLAPEDDQAKARLVELYLAVGMATEAASLSRERLDARPDSADATRSLAIALARMDEFDEARRQADRLIELQPDDLDARLLALEIMAAADRPDTEVRSAAMDAADALGSGTAKAEIALGRGYHLTNNRHAAVRAYDRAAQQIGDDLAPVEPLARFYDAIGEPGKATDLILSLGTDADDASLRNRLVGRLWAQGRGGELLEWVEQVGADSADFTPRSLGLITLTAANLDREAIGSTARDALNARSGYRAEAWAQAIDLFTSEGVESDRRTRQAVLDRLRVLLPGEPLVLFTHARSLIASGRSLEAVEPLQAAARQAPAWSAPLALLARVLTDQGQPDAALQAAQLAVQRNPRSIEASLALIDVLGRRLDDLKPEAQRQLLDQTRRLHDSLPIPHGITASMIASLHVALGEPEAADRFLSEFAADPDTPADAILRPFAIALQHDLASADLLRAAHDQRADPTPSLATLVALAAARDADGDQGRRQGVATFDDLMQRALGDTDQATPEPWALARAELLDRLRHPDASQAWADVIAAAPEDAGVLARVAQSRAAAEDTDLLNLARVRLEATAGPEAIVSSKAHARWLMQSGTSDAQLAEAVARLLEVTRRTPNDREAFDLLATAFERLGNQSRAADTRSTLLRLDPENDDNRLKLVDARIQLGQREQVRDLLNPLLARAELADGTRTRLAIALARVGDTDASAEQFERLYEARPEDARIAMMLAQAREQQGRLGDAATLIETAIRGEPDDAVLGSAAAFYLRQERVDRAREVLDRLDAKDAGGQAEMIRAATAARAGDAEASLAALQRAAQHPATAARAHDAIVRLHVQTGDAERAIAAADRAVADLELPGPNAVAALRHAESLRFVTGLPALRPLGLALLEDEQDARAAEATIDLFRRADRAQARITDVIAELGVLATQHPRFMQLPLLRVQLLQRLGRGAEAAETAVNAMRSFPDEATPAWWAAELLASQGRWSDAMVAARRWRSLSNRTAMQADLLIAEAALRTGRSGEAFEQLASYDDTDRPLDDQATAAIASAKARALLLDGDVARARATFDGKLDGSTQMREAFARLAVLALDDATTARDWLDHLAGATPTDAPAERVTLARSYRGLDERFGPDAGGTAVARDILEPLVDAAEPSPDAVVTLAVIEEATGNTSAAAELYSLALELNPDRPIALNNLAMMLLETDPPLALEKARRAVALAPRVAVFHDTLALAHLAVGQPDDAVTQAVAATRLEPNVAIFQLTLAEALIARGHPDDLPALREKLVAGLDAGRDDLPPDLVDKTQGLIARIDRQLPASEPDSDATPTPAPETATP